MNNTEILFTAETTIINGQSTWKIVDCRKSACPKTSSMVFQNDVVIELRNEKYTIGSYFQIEAKQNLLQNIHNCCSYCALKMLPMEEI